MRLLGLFSPSPLLSLFVILLASLMPAFNEGIGKSLWTKS